MTCSSKLVAVIIYLSGIKNKRYSIQAVERDIHSAYCTYIDTRHPGQNRILHKNKNKAL